MGHTLNFVNSWLQSFENNYSQEIIMYRDKIDYLFQNINFIIPKTQPYKYKKKINKLFTYTGRKWYINKIRYKPPPIQSPRLRK